MARRGASPGIKQAKNTYSSVDDYISTFEPLLFEEVKAQIVQRNDDDQEDSVIEWKHGAVAKCSESDGFHLPEVTYGSPLKDTSIAQNDLLLLTKEKFQDGKKLPTTFAFALVEHRQIRDLGGSDVSNDYRCRIVHRLKMYLAGEVMYLDGDKLEPHPRLLNMRSLISEIGKSVYILELCSLSTISREYIAVRSVGSLPYKDLILEAAEKSQNSENRAWKISKPLVDYIRNNLNESQQQAINY